MYTYAVALSSVRPGWWHQHAALECMLVPQRVTCKISSSNIISVARIKCRKYKIQFDIYFSSRKTQLNITSCTCYKLNRELQIFWSIGKCQFLIHKAQLVKCWKYLIEFSSKNFVSPPSPNPNKEQNRQCTYKLKFLGVFLTIVAVNKE